MTESNNFKSRNVQITSSLQQVSYGTDPINLKKSYNMWNLTEDSVDGIHCSLIRSSIANQPLRICKGYVRWGGFVPYVICDDLNPSVLPHCHTRVVGSEVDSDRRTFSFPSHNIYLTRIKTLLREST
ncbi:hypothetical protein QQ045_016423 [Rhodiola kirilowii]